MKLLCIALLAAATLSGASAAQTFAGTITDDQCPKADHSAMRMGPTDAECAEACASYHAAAYVLFDGTTTYALTNQKALEKFAGQKVRVVGTLDAKSKTIQVDSIVAAK